MGFSLSVVSLVRLCSLDQEIPASYSDLGISYFVIMVSSSQDFIIKQLLPSILFFLSHDQLVDSMTCLLIIYLYSQDQLI